MNSKIQLAEKWVRDGAYTEVGVIFGTFREKVIGSFAKSMCIAYKCNPLLIIFHIFSNQTV